MGKFLTQFFLSVAAAIALHHSVLEPWWLIHKPRRGQQIVAMKPEWFFSRDSLQHSVKYGCDRVGYTDIDYDYIANREFLIDGKRTRINSWGYRGAEPPEGPVDLRVVFAGDSFCFGGGVEEGETLPDNFKRAWEQAHPGKVVDACNLGVGGYSFYASVEAVTDRGFALNPDAVVLVTYNADWNAAGIQRLKKACAQFDIALHLAFCPAKSLDDARIEAARSQAMRIARQCGIELWDMGEGLLGETNRSSLVAFDGHPSPKAHALMGSWLAKQMDSESNDFVQAKRSGLLLPLIECRWSDVKDLEARESDLRYAPWLSQRTVILSRAMARMRRKE
ncbi:MAG: SGNH/GDSL hydrolase family protein [Planctomycetota bacterium]